MAKAAQAALNLDLPASWVVGDRPEDIGLAEAVGASAIYVGDRPLPAPGCLVVPEPGRRGPVHPGAHRRMSSIVRFPGLRAACRRQPGQVPDRTVRERGIVFRRYAEEMARAAKTIDPEALDRAAAILLEAYLRGARMFSCGNGGSASIANHMQCDHVKGIRTATDLSPQVLSLSTNVELLTAIANDIGYENVFVYQLQSQSAPGDVLVAVSSSGRSPNIVRALTWARDARPPHHRDHRLRRRRRQDRGRGQHSCRLHELRHRRGLASGHHARSGPVHPPVANERGRDLDDCVLNHGSRWKPGRHAKAGRPDTRRTESAGTNARGDQPPDGEPGAPFGRALVLDPGDPGDGQAT